MKNEDVRPPLIIEVVLDPNNKEKRTKFIELGAYEECVKRISAVLFYCEPHLDQMWAASVVGEIIGCDFRDAKQEYANMKDFFLNTEKK